MFKVQYWVFNLLVFIPPAKLKIKSIGTKPTVGLAYQLLMLIDVYGALMVR
jgi:hypothetical protein